jgi:hypothetical protein
MWRWVVLLGQVSMLDNTISAMSLKGEEEKNLKEQRRKGNISNVVGLSQ